MMPQSYFGEIVLAGIGGIVVVVGLLAEHFCDAGWYEYKCLPEARRKSVKYIGELFVIIGVGIEVFVGIHAAKDAWKNNPLKNPIANASATVRFLVKIKSYDAPYFPTEPDDIVGWKSQIMFFTGTNANSTNLVLQMTAFQNDAVVFNRGLPPQRLYQLQFHTDPLIDFSNSSGNKNRPAEILNDVASFILAMPQLETNAEILSGSVIFVSNGKTWTFEIPAQRQKWGVISSERIINADRKPETKVMPVQIGDMAFPPRWTNRWYDGK